MAEDNMKTIYADDYHDMFDIEYGKERDAITVDEYLNYFNDGEDMEDKTDEEVRELIEALTDEQVADYWSSYLGWYLADIPEMHPLEKPLHILVIGTAQRWDGKMPAYYKVRKINTVNELMSEFCDYERTLYIENGYLKLDLAHHDGTHAMDVYAITDKAERNDTRFYNALRDFIYGELSEIPERIAKLKRLGYIENPVKYIKNM